ncbi:MAG: glycoside hydrolase family 16 protein [Paludibacter sp.]|nr:glycoside hydrolase family 16 protein [Paludibacter sp.]
MKKALMYCSLKAVFAAMTVVMSFSFCTENLDEALKNADQPEDSVHSPAFAAKGTLIWQDEFNYTGAPDPAKWNTETGIRNNELQYYTNRDVNRYVSNGSLHLIAIKESYGGKNYTSGKINTRNKFTTKYGRVEARIKLPVFKGEFPAFWTLGANIGTYPWPACGEIDIMEQLNTNNTIYGTTHWDNNGHKSSSGSTTTTIGSWHVYAVEWTSASIKWYVDSNLYKTFNILGAPNGTWELHQPHYLLLNLAVGGDWPGFVVDDSKLPAQMDVDYVRVYSMN